MVMSAQKRPFLLVLTIVMTCTCLPGTAQETLGRLYHVPLPAHTAKEAAALRIPFVDDFSDYEGQPNPDLWLESGSLVNRAYDLLPPTIGMVTLDAIAIDGRFHNRASTEPFGGDTLQSRPIRIDSIWGATPRPISIGDSIGLSFYYLPAGGTGAEWQHIGSCPSQADSLILEFWDAEGDHWDRVWATGGMNTDSLKEATGHRWQFVLVMIKHERYLTDRFAFRFRNICSLDNRPESGMIGNTDQWMLDYVQLDRGRSAADTIIHDIAFVAPPPSMLRDYRSMPAHQFTVADMADQIDLTITNRYSSPIAAHYQYTVEDAHGNVVGSYDGGYANVPAFLPGEHYQEDPVQATPPITFTFPATTDEADYTIRHEIREGVGNDIRTENDIMTFEQHFSHYFAYDDGNAEKGYGVVGNGRPSIAVMYDLHFDDTLTAIDLFLNRTYNDANLSIGFRLAVWDDADGVPGTLRYCDSENRYGKADQVGQYQRMVLEQPVAVNAGKIYVGLIQQTAGYLNIGFDCSYDGHRRCFYTTDRQWQTTVYSGNLMIRPCVGAAAIVGIDRNIQPTNLPRIYPNPVTDRLYIQCGLDGRKHIELTDVMGRIVAQTDSEEATITIDTRKLPRGSYLVVVKNTKGETVALKKILK